MSWSLAFMRLEVRMVEGTRTTPVERRGALLEPVAEVRDLPAARPPGGHDGRGGRGLAGGPSDDHGIRTVAKEGALEALAKSRPGARTKERDFELEAARADAVRLGEALKEMAVKLMVVEGKGHWG